jgi:uncharacterized peroxidase-related enzyme
MKTDGFVGNVTRLWCWRPDVLESFSALRGQLMRESALSEREWAVLVVATAVQRGDSYCALAWGSRLARLADSDTAAAVIEGDLAAASLSSRETALAEWARRVVAEPNAIVTADVERLREVGLDDGEIFEATAFVAFRLAFSTVNDALGAAPDRQLARDAPERVRKAIDFGRPPSATPSRGA